MKQIFLIITFSLSIYAYSQSGADSIHIADLKKQLPTATSTKKVDLLNDLSKEYQFLGPAKKDTAYIYASAALREAEKIAYKLGIAYAYLNLGSYELYRTKNTDAAIKHIRMATDIALNLQDQQLLGWTYLITSDIDNKEKIEYWKKALAAFKQSGDVNGEAEVTTWLCMELGNTEKGFDYCIRSIELTKRKRIHNISWGHELYNFAALNMAELYKSAGDYVTALSYLHDARNQHLITGAGWGMEDVLTDLFVQMKNGDSAIYYAKLNYKGNTLRPISKIRMGEALYIAGDLQQSKHFYRQAIDSLKKRNSSKTSSLMRGVIGIAKVFKSENHFDSSLKYAREALVYSDDYWARQLELTELLSQLHHAQKRDDSAYHYLVKYNHLKDSIFNTQFLWRLNSYKRAAADVKKEADIALKEQKLQQQVMIRNSLVSGLVLLFLIGLFAFRNLHLKRKNERLLLQKNLLQSEQKHSELQRQAVELEMQALRAQMNPHFIFNCLSSINRFIFKNDNEAASDYLTRFSRLIRMVLIHSQKKLITLEDELEMLRLYLDMERLRFKNGFDYSITTNNTIDAGAIFIPPLLLQPFCENAIWHGLMHKEGQGHLIVSVTEDNGVLNCSITDNGVGREKAAAYKSKSAEKQKSLGLKITTERLNLFNKEKKIGTSYTIDDVLDDNGAVAGTQVDLKICYKKSVEEKKIYA